MPEHIDESGGREAALEVEQELMYRSRSYASSGKAAPEGENAAIVDGLCNAKDACCLPSSELQIETDLEPQSM